MVSRLLANLSSYAKSTGDLRNAVATFLLLKGNLIVQSREYPCSMFDRTTNCMTYRTFSFDMQTETSQQSLVMLRKET
jgi:hypothetical protein